MKFTFLYKEVLAEKDGKVQRIFLKLSQEEKRSLFFNLADTLNKKGYSAGIWDDKSELRNFVRNKNMPYNLLQWGDGKTRKTRHLSWTDWEKVNKIINDYMDVHNLLGK